MNIIYLLLSYGAAFVLGCFAASQFKFGEPIEIYRWLITVALFVLFGILSKIETKR